jgi:cell division protein FtsQ
MKRANLKKVIAFTVLSLVLIGFIGFVEKQTLNRIFQGTEISIDGVSGVYFVEKKEISEMLNHAFPDLRVGLRLEDVPIREIEERISGHPFIKSVQVMLGQKGTLNIHIKQHQPIARIAQPYGADGYITTEGKIVPTSTSYTSRVLILEGKYAEELMDSGEVIEAMPELMELITFITEDEFWKAQITEIELNARDDIRLYQQVGNQIIEFGDAMDIEDKFDRISVFYKEILPKKGWNAYDRVSVKFKNQIVCE